MKLLHLIRFLAAMAATLTASVALAAGNTSRVRVLSMNTWAVPWISPSRSVRVAAIADGVARHQPDIVALQELWTEDDADVVRAGLARRGYSHEVWYQPSSVGSFQSAGLLIASRWPLSEARFVPFRAGSVPHTPWHLDWMTRKGVAVVIANVAGFRLAVANAHFQSDYRTGDYEPVRVAQAATLLSAVGQVSADALVLAADFNAGATAMSSRLLTEAGLIRARASDIDDVALRANATRSRIVSVRSLKPWNVRVDGGATVPISDHPVIVAELELSPARIQARRPGALDEPVRFLSNAVRTTRFQRWVALAVGCAFGVGLAALGRRRRSKRRKIGLVACTIGMAWAAYFGLFYATQRIASLEAARATLTTL